MWTTFLALLGVVAAATILAAVLRRAGVPGASIVAGLLAGVLCGPGVLGRVAPESFERWFEGASAARDALAATERRLAADALASTSLGAPLVPPESRAEGEAEGEAEVMRLRLEVESIGWEHRRTERSLVGILAALLLAAGTAEGVRGLRGLRPRVRGDALLLGAWTALVPAGAAAILLSWSIEGSLDAAMWSALLAAAAALSVGPWCLARSDAASAESCEPGGADLVRAAGLLATAIGISLLAAAVVLAGRGESAAIVAAGGVAGGAMLGLIVRGDGAARRFRATAAACLPGVVALAMLRLEPWLDLAWSPLLVAAILVSDGRYAGALVAAVLPGGRGGLRSMRLVLASTAVGPTQAAIAAIAIEWSLLPHEWGLALLLAAALPESTAPLRRRAAEQLADVEVVARREGDEAA